MAVKVGPQGLTQTLSSGYGDGLTAKQKKPVNVPMDPLVLGGNDSTGDENQVETSIITVNNEPKALSLNHTVTKVVTSANGNSASLADGILGQVKTIIHFQKIGGNSNLHIEPANFANGTSITSDSQRRTITLLYDGDNWQVIAGEITGTAEFEIDA